MSQSPTPFPEPGENPLLDAQLAEAQAVKAFLSSPVWTWLNDRLQRQRKALMAKAVSIGGDRPLSTDERMILMGKMALVEEILSRPAMLTDLLARKEAAEMAIPEAVPFLGSEPAIRGRSVL